MNLPEIEWAKLLAAIGGALISMVKWQGTLIERGTMGGAGVLVSYFASDAVSSYTHVPPGLAGFLLGLFGMAIVAKVWDMIAAVNGTKVVGDLWEIALGRLRK
jgi:hypothetical protein